MSYVRPETVISPKVHWMLADVLLDDGPGGPAYALGFWDGEPRIGFRWNGDEGNSLGNPQSRGLATWVMLDPRMHDDVIRLMPVDAQKRARRFFGQALKFDGVTINDNRTSIVFWNLQELPPIVATLACSILRSVLGTRDLSEEQCRLVAESNQRLFEDIATLKFFRGEFKPNHDRKMRVIEILPEDVDTVANKVSSGILQVAKLSGWARL